MKSILFVFLTISVLALVSDLTSISALIAPFGATVLILFEYPRGPFSTPRSYVLGHLIGATVGLLCLEFIPYQALGIGIACGLSLCLMKLTRTMHPPAGGTALVVILTQQPWSFLVTPLALGLLIVGVLFESYRKFLLEQTKRDEMT